MAQLELQIGSTSNRIPVFIQDSVATDGAGKTGLTNASMTGYYWRSDEGNANGTSISVVSATRGSFTSGGFVEKDATHLAGWYEFGLPDAAVATGATWLIVEFTAAGAVPSQIVIQLTGKNPAGVITWQKNVAINNFMFKMKDSSGANKTGLGSGVTATRSIDGAAFAAGSLGAVSEISGGWYKLNVDAASVNGTVIAFNFSGSGAVDTDFTLLTQS